ncbi:MAG TPA: D-hexose-6-phosphate mutarotase, partial [Spongiibacteraceae bacterium]|nr:D-hexose-6-phosphate mutarotase [Spongiibacteraceae bacterium]
MHQSSTTTQIQLEQRGELPVLKICNRHAEAAIALQGAQVLEYTPHGEHPVIWLSDRVEYSRGQGLRGGIPICWPWFGAFERNPAAIRALAHDDNLPAHGLVRTRDWTLHSISDRDDATEIILNFVTDALLQTRWPHAAELQLRVTIGKTLRLELSTRNLGAQPLALAQALHTYFAISTIDKIHLTGFEDSRYIDTLDDWYEHNQQGAIDFFGETDRIYLDVPREVQLHDDGWQRIIHLRATNSMSAVVWNPWIEKSKRLSQFAPDAWRHMVCIETANVLD